MNNEKTKDILKNIGTEQVPEEIQKLAQEISNNFTRQLAPSQKPKKPVLLELIMKSRITKLAAAAVVIFAVTLGMLQFSGGNVTWAAVIEPIFNARTASIDVIIGEQGNQQAVIHDLIMGSRIRRTVSGIDISIIIDLEKMQMLTLIDANKTAILLNLTGLDDVQNYIQQLQNTIVELQNQPDFVVENPSWQELNEQDYLVFVATGGNQTITIWAEPETALPVRIEQVTPNMQILCDNIEFNIDLDESLFNLQVPEDYTIQDSRIDFASNSEEDFIETLRIWAEYIEDGKFPDKINLEDVVNSGTKFDSGLKRANLNEQQQLEIATKWAQGYSFIRFFKGQGQWHYAGTGVELGDAETPIFWYQPQDSATWRVIYGDLSVIDVAPEDLPDSALSDKQTKILESTRQWEQKKFIGAEKDTWHLNETGDIVVFSDITLTKVSQDENAMYIRLPYSFATLESVKNDNEEILFEQVTEDRYELKLPIENLLEGQTVIECIWSIQYEDLEDGIFGKKMKVQGLIPAEGYELNSVLEPDSGFQYTHNSSLTEMRHFQSSGFISVTNNAYCGLSIKKID